MRSHEKPDDLGAECHIMLYIDSDIRIVAIAAGFTFTYTLLWIHGHPESPISLSPRSHLALSHLYSRWMSRQFVSSIVVMNVRLNQSIIPGECVHTHRHLVVCYYMSINYVHECLSGDATDLDLTLDKGRLSIELDSTSLAGKSYKSVFKLLQTNY